MIEKERLLHLLEKCLAAEERSIPLYGQHRDDTGFFAGFDAEGQDDIRKLLSRLSRESEFHMQTYKDLIASIKGSTQNGF